jgi:hypothetical protein
MQNALRQQRFVREVTIGFNLCNEPWYFSHLPSEIPHFQHLHCHFFVILVLVFFKCSCLGQFYFEMRLLIASSVFFFPFRLKYSISIVADKGFKKSLYTSARLKKGEVIYLETHFKRYNLLSRYYVFYACPEFSLLLAYYSLSFNFVLAALKFPQVRAVL